MSYKILWYSLPSLHDTSNGASIRNKVMLESLAARGFQVKALNALVADDPQGLQIFNRITSQINVQPDATYLQFTDTGVEYIVARTKGHVSNDVTAEDQGKVFDLFVQFIEKFQPDVLIGYSGDCFSALIRHEARVRGIPVAYSLCNGLHRSFAFPDCDLVFTPSEATAKMYKESDNIDVKTVGQFIYKDRVVAPNRDKAKAKYITLINPTPEKGLAIFAKIAQVFATKHPDQKFLVVKSVGDYYKIFNSMHNDDGTRFLPAGMVNLPNIDVAEHTDDIRLVYDVTKVLVTPSVWHEAWGRVATEATFNGIPVLSSNSGGLPEAVGGGGIVVDAPEKTLKDFYRVPTDEEIQPWIEALERLLNEDWSEQCAKAAAQNDISTSTDRLVALLMPLMEQGSKEKKPLESSFFFSAETMKKRKAFYEAEAAKAQAESKSTEKTKAGAKTEAKSDAKTEAKSDTKGETKAPAKKSLAKTNKTKSSKDKDGADEAKVPAKKAAATKSKPATKKPAAKKSTASDKK